MNTLLKQRRAHLALAGLCILASTLSVAAQEEVIRVDTELVNLNVVVMDRQGRRVSGLTRDNFEVYEDGVRQEVNYFIATVRPLRIVLVFDVSISMEAILPTVKQEAIALLGSLRPDDQVSVVSFSTDVRLHSGWLDKGQAGDVIRSVAPQQHPQPLRAGIGRTGFRVGDGNTYLYEAFQYIFNNFRAGNDRIAVVMFSDGVDTAAGRAMPNIRRRADEVGKEMRRQAQESWALVYPIRYKTEQAIGERPDPARRPLPGSSISIGLRPYDPGGELFAQIATATGGAVFDWTTGQDLVAAIDDALSDLRSQYSLAYTPPRTGRNDFRRIRVHVKRPNLVVRTREGYFYKLDP